ncbi:DUF2460 domain-containing protein [Pseudoruegeria sp. SK021]|uniref:DUF2460 domain-containing protein n=1 Tax=Pseudoruegeria sp. SK021 TaxID=1933035 RepID=UPI000A25CA50|nr:DUF2460 domain-containing protein [Pseudoruegeria sp. SK021]OSP54338.1 glycoside hydrolase family 24 [Pseudoruegeria sp. SK021]
MSFHDVRFPTSLSFGSAGGPERRTEIVTLANGFEERNTPWSQSRRRYDAGMGVKSLDDMALLTAFFEARQGQVFAFRWKDWADFKSCVPSGQVSALDQALGLGNGVIATFQLVKRYASGDAAYQRPIGKPVAGTVRVAVDGVDLGPSEFSVDITSGVVSLMSAPAVGVPVTAGFEFDVPVRFDTDRIFTSLSSFQSGEISDVPVVEVRV